MDTKTDISGCNGIVRARTHMPPESSLVSRFIVTTSMSAYCAERRLSGVVLHGGLSLSVALTGVRLPRELDFATGWHDRLDT